MTDSRKTTLLHAALISALILAVYGNILSHGFVWDDHYVIVENPLLERLGDIPRLFLMEDRVEAPTGYYRPITYVSFALDRAVWGLNPAGFTITNLLLHLLVTLLFYRVLVLVFKQETFALVAALLFALHPVASETINFHAGGRNTLLCALFSLSTLILYVQNRRLLAVIPFALAIFSKEFALLIPVLLFLYDRVVRGKIRWSSYLPFFLAVICYLTLRSAVVSVHANLLASINPAKALWLTPRIFGSYLLNMIAPFRLKVLYDVTTEFSWPTLIGSYLALLAVAGAVFLLRKHREFVAGALTFCLFFLPVAGFFPIGMSLMADRYAYFSLFGFSLMLAWCLRFVGKRNVMWLVGVICLFYAAIDIQRNSIWKDEFSLAAQMLVDAPEWAIGYQSLGYLHYKKQDYATAEKYLTLAYGKKNVSKKMLVGSAAMLWEMNCLDKALTVLNMKMKLEPRNPQSYIMASRIYEELGNKEQAKVYSDKAIELFPRIFEMMYKRAFDATGQGEAFMARNRPDRAEMLYKEALAIDPGYVPALIDMGILSAEKGDNVKALNYFTKAATLDPNNPVPHHNMSLVYETLGKKREAEAEMMKFKAAQAAHGSTRAK